MTEFKHKRKMPNKRYYSSGISLEQMSDLYEKKQDVEFEFKYVIHVIKNRITIDEGKEDGKFPITKDHLTMIDLILQHGIIAAQQVYLSKYLKK